MTMVIEIENEKLIFNDRSITILIDNKNQIWFKAKDIATILGYKKTRNVVFAHVDDINKTMYKNIDCSKRKNMQPYTVFINNRGLVSLINLKKDSVFKQWIVDKVLPAVWGFENRIHIKRNQLFREVIDRNKAQQIFAILENNDNENTFKNDHKKEYKCINTKYRFYDRTISANIEQYTTKYAKKYLSDEDVMSIIKYTLTEKDVKFSIEKNVITIWGDFDFIKHVEDIIDNINYW